MDLNSLSPKHLLNAGLSAARSVEQVASDGVDAIKSAPSDLLNEAKGLLPERVDLSRPLPPYTKLSPAQRVAAEQRSVGMTYPQDFITNQSGTRSHEPVNLVVSGTEAELVQAFKKAGWTQAATLTTSSGLQTAATMVDELTPLHKLVDFNYKASPMSPMYLDGKHYDLAFNKNDEHNLARDHLRIFKTDKTDAQGRPIWEIAATRDTGLHVGTKTKGHSIDHNIDLERDQVMADLLHGGEVQDWHVAKSSTDPNDPRYKDYQTDHKLYTIDLKSHPDLQMPVPHENLGHQILDHSPGFVKDAEKSVDQKLSNFFKSLNGGV